MLVVGPEDPLVHGIVDFMRKDLKDLLIVGPSKDGAMLEGSKDFAKEFMMRHSIPTAAYKTFSKNQIQEAIEFLDTLNPPYVLKADGLAAGKGVIITSEKTHAINSLNEIFVQSKFGGAGDKIVIEEFLSGIELSVFVLTDGKTYKILPEAKDYKRIGENDLGLNTGGMGAVSPVPFADREFMKKVEDKIIKPTIHGIQEEGFDYKGFIFIGLMNVEGNPFVIEYNVRMGDPETEVVFPRIDSDVLDLFRKTASGNLIDAELKIKNQTALTVMLVSGGYPEKFEKGKEIHFGKELDNSTIYHAGTLSKDGKTYSNGGRVISVTAFGNDIEEARKIAYKQIDKISFEKMYFRRDIGKDLLYYSDYNLKKEFLVRELRLTIYVKTKSINRISLQSYV
jgi:phosphoribosylamine--glycine ligase